MRLPSVAWLFVLLGAHGCASGAEADKTAPLSSGTGGTGAQGSGGVPAIDAGVDSSETGGSIDSGGDAASAGSAGFAGSAEEDAAGEASEACGVAEICNGLDENCDGRIDDGNPGGGEACAVPNAKGACVEGVTACTTGFVACQSLSTPKTELCNGLDDDCDAVVDNGDPGGNQACDTGRPGVCVQGISHCRNGAVACDEAVQPMPEVCNGLDDNCDGVPDDGFSGSGQPCTVAGQLPNTPCAQGLTNCLSGQSGCTKVNEAKPETCNGVDDDCDGTVDNSSAVDQKVCASGLPGVCAAGKTECTGGVSSCVPNIAPDSQLELCNGLDDDCDGSVDDVTALAAECGQRLPLALNVAGWLCTGGACTIGGCAGAFANCDGAPGNGCETNTGNDPSHCGTCTTVCSGTGGSPVCSGGVCSGISCSAGLGNCDANPGNGCETDLTTLTNCGTCGKACSANHGTPSCVGGSCQIACSSGWDNCDGNLANGCETSIGSVNNCGGCGQPCSAANGTPLCSSGQCSITCNAGWGNCDADARGNGCETNTQIDSAHCGTCATVCAVPTPTCAGGSCTGSVAACAPGHVFCDDFEDGNADGWTPSGGSWSVITDGTFVYKGDGGDFQSLAGSSHTDQTVEAKLKVLQFGGSSGSYRAGLVARHTGSSNYYALEIDPTGKLRLLKGTSSISGCSDLPSGVSPLVGTWSTLKLQVSGPASQVHIVSWVNGVQKHDCTISSGIASGSAGVATFGSNTRAEFDDFGIWTP
jgi:hypothetical protein